MSMMMPPEAPPGLPIPPGGGEAMMGGPAPPMDAMNQAPFPGEGGMGELMAALSAEQPAPSGPPAPGGPLEESPEMGMSPIEHIQQAMKHLLMAMSMDEDEERGLGITKGMGALQAILGGEQKKQNQMAALGG